MTATFSCFSLVEPGRTAGRRTALLGIGYLTPFRIAGGFDPTAVMPGEPAPAVLFPLAGSFGLTPSWRIEFTGEPRTVINVEGFHRLPVAPGRGFSRGQGLCPSTSSGPGNLHSAGFHTVGPPPPDGRRNGYSF